MTASISHHFGGGTYAKEVHIAKGKIGTQHVHKHDHLSILASGIAAVNVAGESVIYKAPACLTIAAGKVHTVTALTDIVWYCIHATDETDAAHIDEVLIGK